MVNSPPQAISATAPLGRPAFGSPGGMLPVQGCGVIVGVTVDVAVAVGVACQWALKLASRLQLVSACQSTSKSV
jgi:hypothetical protein